MQVETGQTMSESVLSHRLTGQEQTLPCALEVHEGMGLEPESPGDSGPKGRQTSAGASLLFMTIWEAQRRKRHR